MTDHILLIGLDGGTFVTLDGRGARPCRNASKARHSW
jgi:hypothetical protein